MMTTIAGVLGAALLFGVFAALRPRDKDGCTGNCAACTHDHACEQMSDVIPNEVRDLHVRSADSSLRSD